MPDIKRHPLSLILTVLALLLVVPLLAYSVIHLEGPRIQRVALADLSAIGKLKTNQIESWLAERRDDAAMLMTRDRFIDDVESWLDRRDPVAEARLAIRQKSLRHAFYTMEFLDVHARPDSLEPGRRAQLAAALTSGRPQMSDLYRDRSGQVWLDLVVPLVKPATGKLVGAAVLRSQASAFLFPLVQSWPTSSPSAESLLARRDGGSVMFLNELRHRKGTSLTLRLPLDAPELPAAIAARGGVAQTIAGRDYRGIPVLAAVRPVRGTAWFLVAKVDRDEVMQPLYTLVTWVGTVALAAFIVITVILLLLWRQQQHNHRLELLARTGERDRLLSLFYDLPFMGMAIVDPDDGHWLHANERLCELLGYSHAELLATTTWQQLTHPDDLAADLAEYQRMLAGERDGYQRETRFLRKDGSPVDVALAAKCVRRPDGSVEYIVKTMRDIGERKRLEAAQAAQHRATGLLDAIAAASTDAIFAKDTAGNFLFFNEAAARWVNKRPQDVIGHDTMSLFPPELAARIMASDRQIMTSREPMTFEETLPSADGERAVLTTKGPLLGSDGQVFGLYGIARDISERKQIEQSLSESRARLAGIIDSAMDAIITLDAEQRVRIFNPAAERMFGIKAAEMLGASIERLIPIRLRQEHRQHLQHFADEGTTSRSMTSLGELHALRSDGTEFPIEAAISQASVAGQQFFSVILRDISARKAAEAALRYQLDLTRGITEKATYSIFINDAAGRVIEINPEAEKTFGYTNGELAGKVLHDVIHHRQPDGQAYPMHDCPLCHVYLTGEVIRDHEAIVYRKDGSALVVTGSNAALESGGKIIGAALILHDITAIKQTEQTLREREDDLNRAQAVGHIGSWRLDVRRNELTWSQENHRIFGVAEGTPKAYETFLSCVHPEDRDYVDREWQAALRGGTYDIEHRLLVDGKVKWVREKAELEFAPDGNLLGAFGTSQDISELKATERALEAARVAAIEEKNLLETVMQALPVGVAIVDDLGALVRNNADYERIWRGPLPAVRTVNDYAAYQAWWVDSGQPVQPHEWGSTLAVQTGELVANQLLQIQRFDGSRAYVLNSAAPIRDAHDKIIGSAVVIQDISELMQAEQALREADQRKDEFLAMLAHELRNPLAPIRNAAYVLGRLELAEPRVRWAQDIIERQVAHLTHLVDELLDVSRIAQGKVSLKKSRIELADLVRQACESVQPLMSAKRHCFEVRMPAAGVILEGDLVRLIQVLQNLLNNAAKYTPDGGHIELTGRPLGQMVELQVRDNGMGISADLLPGVFDLFRQGERTLDRSQGGLGIGLTLVRRLVELHGGQVEAHSAGPGQGASFTLQLPVAGSATEAALPIEGKPGTGAARLRVLVVDDDPVVAESMVVFLELEGHQVRSAASGAAALHLLAEFQPQVVLLDIGLPGQDGYEVARRIRQAPGGAAIELVAVSGYGHEEAMERSRQAGFDRHLVKPVEPEKLGALLAEIGARG